MSATFAEEWKKVIEAEAARPPVHGPHPYAVFFSDGNTAAERRAKLAAYELGPTAHVRRRDDLDPVWGWVGDIYEVYP